MVWRDASAIELSNYMTVEILNVEQPKLIPKMKEGVKWMILVVKRRGVGSK